RDKGRLCSRLRQSCSCLVERALPHLNSFEKPRLAEQREQLRVVYEQVEFVLCLLQGASRRLDVVRGLDGLRQQPILLRERREHLFFDVEIEDRGSNTCPRWAEAFGV